MIVLYMLIGALALVGLVVVVWVAVRLPFWLRDLRREDREAETQRVVDAVGRYDSDGYHPTSDPVGRLSESEQRLRETLDQ